MLINAYHLKVNGLHLYRCLKLTEQVNHRLIVSKLRNKSFGRKAV